MDTRQISFDFMAACKEGLKFTHDVPESLFQVQQGFTPEYEQLLSETTDRIGKLHQADCVADWKSDGKGCQRCEAAVEKVVYKPVPSLIRPWAPSIPVSTVPVCHREACAEHALALLKGRDETAAPYIAKLNEATARFSGSEEPRQRTKPREAHEPGVSRQEPVTILPLPARGAPCHCGSRRKYKKCCGASQQSTNAA